MIEKFKQVDQTMILVITSNDICAIEGAPTHFDLLRDIRSYIKKGYLTEIGERKITLSQESQETTPLFVKKSKYKTKQGKYVNNYLLSNKAAVFISAKFSDSVRLQLVNTLEVITNENQVLLNKQHDNEIALLQSQLEVYQSRYAINDRQIFKESEIPKNYIQLSEIKRSSRSGLPKNSLLEILLAMKVPYIEYKSLYQADFNVVEGKVAKAFKLREKDSNLNLIRDAFDRFKYDLEQISKYYSYSRILNRKIKYVQSDQY